MGNCLQGQKKEQSTSISAARSTTSPAIHQRRRQATQTAAGFAHPGNASFNSILSSIHSSPPCSGRSSYSNIGSVKGGEGSSSPIRSPHQRLAQRSRSNSGTTGTGAAFRHRPRGGSSSHTLPGCPSGGADADILASGGSSSFRDGLLQGLEAMLDHRSGNLSKWVIRVREFQRERRGKVWV